MPMADRRYSWVLLLALALIGWHQSALVLPKDIPVHYRQALELIFDEGRATKIKREGRPIRIQLLNEMDNVNFIALVASTALRQSPKGRCAIIVSNIDIAQATCEKLMEHNIATNVSTQNIPSDPMARVAVCTRCVASKALLGQSFDIMVLGYVPRRKVACLGPKNVHAKRTVMVAPNFFYGGLEPDYAYFYEQAYQDGKVAPLDAFMMPVLSDPSTRDVLIDKVAQVLGRKSADWGPTFLFVERLDLATLAVAKLQDLGVSAQLWPEYWQRKKREIAAEALAKGDLQVACSTYTQHSSLLPTCVRSIAHITLSWEGSRAVPASLFQALRSLSQSGNTCTYLHIIANCRPSDNPILETKFGIMSLPFWSERENRGLSLDEAGSIIDKTAGVSLSLLNPNGQFLKATLPNAQAIFASQRAERAERGES